MECSCLSTIHFSLHVITELSVGVLVWLWVCTQVNGGSQLSTGFGTCTRTTRRFLHSCYTCFHVAVQTGLADTLILPAVWYFPPLGSHCVTSLSQVSCEVFHRVVCSLLNRQVDWTVPLSLGWFFFFLQIWLADFTMQDAGESGLPRTVVAFCCYCGSEMLV